MAGKGGARPGAGRKAGVPNKATADVKEAARIHGPDAIKVLASLMIKADTDSAKISAANSILDRAYGKATTVVGNEEGEAFKVVHELILRGVQPHN
jgi:hypothetical protein